MQAFWRLTDFTLYIFAEAVLALKNQGFCSLEARLRRLVTSLFAQFTQITAEIQRFAHILQAFPCPSVPNRYWRPFLALRIASSSFLMSSGESLPGRGRASLWSDCR